MLILVFGAVMMLAVSIIVHELGHLLCGLMVGVKARIFSLGYGRGIWKKKYKGTIYQITSFPVGGYVLFRGDNYNRKRKGQEGELLSVPPLKRIIPVAGGPLFNLILGFVIFFLLGFFGDAQMSNKIFIDETYSRHSQAWKAGLRSGDRITAINNEPVATFEDLLAAVGLSSGEPLKLEYERDGIKKSAIVNPDVTGDRPMIGVMPAGERRIIATFSYMEQLRYSLSTMLDSSNESEKYFNEKFPVQNDERRKKAIKEHEQKQVLKTRAIEYLNDGDVIMKVAGRDIYSVESLQRTLGEFQNREVPILVERKKYPLLTPWATEPAEIRVPVMGAWLIEFSDLQEKEINDFKLENFALASYDPELEKHLANIRINGKKYSTFDELRRDLDPSGTLEMQVGKIVYNSSYEMVPIGLLGFRPSMKFIPENTETDRGIVEAFEYAASNVYKNVAVSLKGIGMIFKGLVSPKNSLTGPVGIFEYAGTSLEYGWATYLDFVAKISIALMIMNLLPIPLVDGGHILLYLIEAVTGRPLPAKTIDFIFRLGFMFLISLALMVTYFDIMRIIN